MSVAEFYHILMCNKLQWKYKEVQVVMVNLRYHLDRLKKTIKPSDRLAYIKAQIRA